MVAAPCRARGRKEVDLSNNGIGPRSCLVLAASLAVNTALRVLVLDRNPLGAEGGTHLLVGITRNSGLERCGMQGVSFVDYVEVGGGHRVLFNRINPNAEYSLDLADPAERQIATELVHLRAKFGNDTWQRARLDGRSFAGPEDRDHWPERMPETGTLDLTYAADMLAIEHHDVRPPTRRPPSPPFPGLGQAPKPLFPLFPHSGYDTGYRLG